VTSTAGLSRRRRSAYAAALAAKQRRQKIFVGVGVVILVGVLAYEIPHTLKLLNGQPASAPARSSTPASPTHPGSSARKALRGTGRGSDPFVARGVTDEDSTVGAALPGRDPFASPSQQTSVSVPVAPTSKPLPKQIVIGTPGKGRHAVHGWIVILASIPTGEGRSAADGFARAARAGGLNSVAVLNSSNRRPLRGGYWVVYTGPYPTLGAVVSHAAAVHSVGYRGAYIRELIVYR
jgi:hypothetical protein